MAGPFPARRGERKEGRGPAPGPEHGRRPPRTGGDREERGSPARDGPSSARVRPREAAAPELRGERAPEQERRKGKVLIPLDLGPAGGGPGGGGGPSVRCPRKEGAARVRRTFPAGGPRLRSCRRPRPGLRAAARTEAQTPPDPGSCRRRAALRGRPRARGGATRPPCASRRPDSGS